MELMMKNKVVLLVGGCGGTGEAASLLFAKEGVKVVIADIREDVGEEIVEQVKQSGGDAAFVKCDVLFEEEVAAATQFALDKYGKLDYAVNIVGLNNKFTGIADLTKDDFDDEIKISLRSSFFAMKYEIPAMIKTGAGSIVNVGSPASLVAVLAHGAYTPAEHALVGLTKSAALDYAKQGIRVNIICPGIMLSDVLKKLLNDDPHYGDKLLVNMPSGKFTSQEDVAAAYVYLCSQYASNITGAVLTLDGGWVA